jgi:competence protein ComEC
VTIGLVPLTLVLFQQVSLISPIANAIAIPLVSYLVTPLALIGALICCLGEPLLPVAQTLLQASDALFELLAALLTWLVQLPYSWVGFAAPPAWAVAVAGLGIFWLLAPAGWPLRWVGAAWLVPAFVMPTERPQPGGLWLTALDVGQGMALVLETADTTLVFDTGPRVSQEADAGGRVIVPYLRARGIDRVGLLVVSHLDSDHSGGARSLADAITVERVLTSIDAGDPMLPAVRDVQRCQAGQHTSLGKLQLAVLNPPAALYERPRATTNSKSCVILAQLGAIRALLTGDVPAREEAGMVAAFGSTLQAQMMVAPHHGSKTSSSEVLVEAVHPTWVSVQAGYRSRFGHPHPDVMARYAQHGARVVRSDWSGAARWRFGPDGSVTLEQWRLDHARYWLNQPARSRSQGELAEHLID